MFRTIKIALNRYDWSPPSRATHVLQWLPPQLLERASGDPDDGLWEIQTLGDFLAGTPSGDLPGMYGPSTVLPDDLAAFIWNEWREVLWLTPFPIEIEDIGIVPAYWLTPTGAGRL